MSSLYDSLSEAVGRLKNQIYILSAVFGILIVVVDLYGKLTTELLAGLIIVYVIALCAAYYQDQRRRQLRSPAATATEEKETEKQGIKWQMSFPASLPNPLDMGLGKWLSFTLQFTVLNDTKENQRVTVYVDSPTQAIKFEHDVEITKWRLKYGLIPARHRSKFWLDDFITAKISPGQRLEFKFHAVYVKLEAIDLAVGHRAVPIRYRIMAVDEDERITIDSESRRLEIPMERRTKG
jgi:hypothetical protein